jgi:hypothetical protein
VLVQGRVGVQEQEQGEELEGGAGAAAARLAVLLGGAAGMNGKDMLAQSVVHSVPAAVASVSTCATCCFCAAVFAAPRARTVNCSSSRGHAAPAATAALLFVGAVADFAGFASGTGAGLGAGAGAGAVDGMNGLAATEKAGAPYDETKLGGWGAVVIWACP